VFDGNWELGGEGRSENFTTSTDRAAIGSRSLRVHSTGMDDGLQAINHTLDQGGLTGTVSVDFYDYGDGRSLGSAFSVTNRDRSQYVIFQIKEDKSNYVYRIQDAVFDSQVPRTAGWHTLEFVITTSGGYCKIDGQALLHHPCTPNTADDNLSVITTNPNSNDHLCDTRGEETGSTAMMLATAYSMFPNHPDANRWNEAAKAYAFHTLLPMV